MTLIIILRSFESTRSTDDIDVAISPARQKTEIPKENPQHDVIDRGQATPSTQDGASASPREPLFAVVLREVAADRERAASSTLDGASASRNFGYLPGEATADQVYLALEHDINPFTNQPHTAQYKKILEGRKTLPVFAHMAEFYKIVSFMHTSHHSL